MIHMPVPRSIWTLDCRYPDGSPKWVEEYDNAVMIQGINDLIDKYFKGAAYTAAWFVGLIAESSTIATTDTAALHPGWSEVTTYGQTARPALVLSGVAGQSVNNSASKASFTMTSDKIVSGSFLATSDVKGGTGGILYAAAQFSTGAKTLLNGEILNASVVISAA